MIIAPFCPPHRDTNTKVPDVPYALAMQCKLSVVEYAPDAVFVDTSVSTFDYWRALSSNWNQGDDLIVIEHDIEITSNVIPSFRGCPESWCTFRYESRAGRGDYWTESLGCVKFSAELQAYMDIRDEPVVYWLSIDDWMRTNLRNRGFIAHVHGTVRHLHYPQTPGN